jgi:two-component system, LytTR family, sensor kinase
MTQSKMTPLMAYFDAFKIILFQVITVYFIVIYLMNRFLFRKKKFAFFSLSFLTILVTSYISTLAKDYFTRWFFNPEHHSRYITVWLGDVVDSFIVSFVFIVIYLAWHYYRNDQKNKLMERQRLQAELDFLKAQLNPHFVFNTLNSIYVLMDEDINVSRDTLLRFSSLLRYQLYDCSTQYTSLEKELNFIGDFIELEKIRYGNKIEVTYTKHEIPYDAMIAPLMLIPFVENAFKHITMKRGETSFIRIEAGCRENKFYFTVVNSFDGSLWEKKEAGGIGLQNVRRRLELIYPGAYDLNAGISDGKYSVTLNVQLHETEVPHSR